jgi:hypothetical protein
MLVLPSTKSIPFHSPDMTVNTLGVLQEFNRKIGGGINQQGRC